MPHTPDEVLSDALKCKKTGVPPKNIYVCDGLRSGTSRRAVGHDFNINESTIYIKQEIKQENVTSRGSQEPTPCISPRSNGHAIVNSVFAETLNSITTVKNKN